MIRKYQPQDLEHIMKIWLETNLAAHGFIPAEYWNEQYEAVKEALPQADILIYEEEGTVLGFLGLQDSYIAGLFVEKASRSRGIGRLLLEAAKSGRQELTLMQRTQEQSGFMNEKGFKRQHLKRKKRRDVRVF